MSTAPSRAAKTSGPALTCQTYGSSVQCNRTVAVSISVMSAAPQARSALKVRALRKITAAPSVHGRARSSAIGGGAASDRDAYFRKNPAMQRVVALALPAVVMFDLAIPAEVFSGDGYSFTVCTPSPGHVPSTTPGVSVHIPSGLDALDAAGTVVVPGYAPLEEPPADVLDALRAAAARGARVVSVCTGAFALAAAGLLDGRPATTHWMDAPELAARYPAVQV